MNPDEILKKMADDLKPQLIEMFKSAALECCSWCEEEVPFQIVGVYRDGSMTQHSGGISVTDEGKWKLFGGHMRDEPNGVLRDYTGWARLRLSYVDPNDSSKNQKVKADEAADGVKVVIRCEDRRLLVCPACLETSGLLTAKYYVNKYEGKGPERVDPDPEGSLCEHKAERGKCLVKGCINIVPCKDKHYPGVVCGTCGMVLSSDDDYAEEEPAQTSTPGCVTFACKEKHYPGVACGVCGVMGPHYGSSICKLHVDNWRGSCDLCKKLCDGHSVRPCAVNSVNKKACGHYDESGSFSP